MRGGGGANARLTGSLIELSVVAGDVIHVLQIERGATAGYGKRRPEAVLKSDFQVV